MKPLVAIDCDGPLSNFVGALCDALHRRGFPRRDPSTILHWDLKLSLTSEEYKAAGEIMSSPGFVIGMSWTFGAKTMVRELRSAGADVVVLTSPYRGSRTWMDERVSWLSELFDANDVMFVGTERKKHVRADLLIEDHPGTAAAWLDVNPKARAILVDFPWNRPGAKEWTLHRRMVRCQGSADVARWARYLFRGR